MNVGVDFPPSAKPWKFHSTDSVSGKPGAVHFARLAGLGRVAWLDPTGARGPEAFDLVAAPRPFDIYHCFPSPGYFGLQHPAPRHVRPIPLKAKFML